MPSKWLNPISPTWARNYPANRLCCMHVFDCRRVFMESIGKTLVNVDECVALKRPYTSVPQIPAIAPDITFPAGFISIVWGISLFSMALMISSNLDDCFSHDQFDLLAFSWFGNSNVWIQWTSRLFSIVLSPHWSTDFCLYTVLAIYSPILIESFTRFSIVFTIWLAISTMAQLHITETVTRLSLDRQSLFPFSGLGWIRVYGN